MTAKLLSQLIHNAPKVMITGLTQDSRTTKPGDLFFAKLPNYIDEAIQNGAVAVVCTQPVHKNYTVPIIPVENLPEKIGAIAADFYNHPSKKLRVIGVTGTTGKTSCTYFIAKALQMAGLKTALIGTLGNGPIDQLTESSHTTPDAIQLQALFALFVSQGIEVVAMEVSSHGLDQGRTIGTQFYAGAFTNLSHEHLDYHGTMDHYAHTKFKLFEQIGLESAIFNVDDSHGQHWITLLSPRLKVYGYSIDPSYKKIHDFPLIQATHIQTHCHGLTATLNTPWGKGVLHTALLGEFNISNLCLVTAVLGQMGYGLPDILEYFSQLKSVPGRMQAFGGDGKKPLVIVDYSHKPDALEKALKTLRLHCKGDLWCVFGCGGDRDREKRPLMGKIAETYADHLIITNDNPRTENPNTIIQDICNGISNNAEKIIEQDRKRAITHAIACAKPNDIVLIAGKGHETYQYIGHERFPFSDIIEVKMQLLAE